MIEEPLQADGCTFGRRRLSHGRRGMIAAPQDDWRAAAGSGIIGEPLQADGFTFGRLRGMIEAPLRADGYASRCGFVMIYRVMRS
jgi:hypothetical protein